jgi:hypothetical protein
MATRINIMKLLQEVRGLAEITNRHAQGRSGSPGILQLRGIRWKESHGRRRRTIRIDMQDPPDIPHPVKIIYSEPDSRPSASA